MLKPYVKEKLEEKIGLPVEIQSFTLESGRTSLDFVINKQAAVRVVAKYRLWEQSFEGRYQLRSDSFSYEALMLKETDLKGHFKGVSEEFSVEGKGTALGAKVDYHLHVINHAAEKIILHMKGAELSDLLQLYGHPALAEGKIDVEVNMPDIGEAAASGYGHIVLHKAHFNRKLLKELYDYTLPEKSYLHGRIDANLEGKNVTVLGKVQSDLFTLQINNALVNMLSGQWSAGYSLDVKELRLLTKNKLSGPLKLDGTVERKEKKVRVTGISHSLGGALRFSIDESTQISFEKLALEKLLSLLKKPVYAKGEVSGTVALSKENRKEGSYTLRIDKGELSAKAIEKWSRYRIPAKNTFSLNSKGTVADQKLKGSATVHSTLADVTLTDLKYDLQDKTVVSRYTLLMHDLNAWFPKSQVAGGMPVSAEGELKFTDSLSISGQMRGLGKKLDFSYDGKTAKVNASQLFAEKMLALTGLPVYAKGTLDTHMVLTNLKPAEGTFTLKSIKLVTDPHAMKKLTGEALKVSIVLDASGTFKKGIGYIHTRVKSSLGNIYLDNMLVDREKKHFKGTYTLEIPNLKKLHKVIDRKLYGPLVLKGEWSKNKSLTLTGVTSTLGGKIHYTLRGEDLHSTISSVPLKNILGILGHKKNFLGLASGKGKYHLKKKSGVVDLDIASFQIKPSSLTSMIKMVIGKDPARVIFSSTKFHADIKGKITAYTLHAKGTRSSIDITEGRVDKRNNTHRAKFKFVYEKYTVSGKIRGTIDDPKVSIDTSALFKNRIDDKLQNKIEKVLGGKAGEFLKGLSF
ncbi:MAG: hypothetical protein COB07_10360 [Sulfurovum sp.]|nr:MAG: hypothetical protein COB07_10360 [Sulfurovum sp.]